MGIKVYKSGYQVIVDDPSKDDKIYKTAYFTRFGFNGDNVWIKDLDFGDLIFLGNTFIMEDSAGNVIGGKSEVETYLLSFIGADNDTVSTIVSPYYILDAYADSTAGFSFRKLQADATNSVEIRRSSDDTLTDVILSTDESVTLDSLVSAGGSLRDWVGSESAFVRTWYDQSGVGNDAVQTVNASQPSIITSGVLYVYNSLADLKFNGSSTTLDPTYLFSDPIASFCVFNIQSLSELCVFNMGNGSDKALSLSANRTSGILVKTSSAPVATPRSIAYSQDTQYIDFIQNKETATIINDHDLNSVGYTGSITGRSSFTGKAIGSRGVDYFHNGGIQELLLFDADKTTDRAAIETNINSFYSVY